MTILNSQFCLPVLDTVIVEHLDDLFRQPKFLEVRIKIIFEPHLLVLGCSLAREDLVPYEFNSGGEARPLTHGQKIKQGEMLSNKFRAKLEIDHLGAKSLLHVKEAPGVEGRVEDRSDGVDDRHLKVMHGAVHVKFAPRIDLDVFEDQPVGLLALAAHQNVIDGDEHFSPPVL